MEDQPCCRNDLSGLVPRAFPNTKNERVCVALITDCCVIGKWHNTIIRNHLVRKPHLHRFHQVRQFFAIPEEKRLVFRNAAIEAEKCLRKRVKSSI